MSKRTCSEHKADNCSRLQCMMGYWLLVADTVFSWETINVLTTAILQHITATLATVVGSLLSSLWRCVIFLWGSKQKLQREVNDCKAHKITMFTISHHTRYIHSITAWWKAPSNRSLTIGVIYTDLMGHLFPCRCCLEDHILTPRACY